MQAEKFYDVETYNLLSGWVLVSLTPDSKSQSIVVDDLFHDAPYQNTRRGIRVAVSAKWHSNSIVNFIYSVNPNFESIEVLRSVCMVFVKYVTQITGKLIPLDEFQKIIVKFNSIDDPIVQICMAKLLSLKGKSAYESIVHKIVNRYDFSDLALNLFSFSILGINCSLILCKLNSSVFCEVLRKVTATELIEVYFPYFSSFVYDFEDFRKEHPSNSVDIMDAFLALFNRYPLAAHRKLLSEFLFSDADIAAMNFCFSEKYRHPEFIKQTMRAKIHRNSLRVLLQSSEHFNIANRIVGKYLRNQDFIKETVAKCRLELGDFEQSYSLVGSFIDERIVNCIALDVTGNEFVEHFEVLSFDHQKLLYSSYLKESSTEALKRIGVDFAKQFLENEKDSAEILLNTFSLDTLLDKNTAASFLRLAVSSCSVSLYESVVNAFECDAFYSLMENLYSTCYHYGSRIYSCWQVDRFLRECNAFHQKANELNLNCLRTAMAFNTNLGTYVVQEIGNCIDSVDSLEAEYNSLVEYCEKNSTIGLTSRCLARIFLEENFDLLDRVQADLSPLDETLQSVLVEDYEHYHFLLDYLDSIETVNKLTPLIFGNSALPDSDLVLEEVSLDDTFSEPLTSVSTTPSIVEDAKEFWNYFDRVYSYGVLLPKISLDGIIRVMNTGISPSILEKLVEQLGGVQEQCIEELYRYDTSWDSCIENGIVGYLHLPLVDFSEAIQKCYSAEKLIKLYSSYGNECDAKCLSFPDPNHRFQLLSTIIKGVEKSIASNFLICAEDYSNETLACFVRNLEKQTFLVLGKKTILSVWVYREIACQEGFDSFLQYDARNFRSKAVLKMLMYVFKNATPAFPSLAKNLADLDPNSVLCNELVYSVILNYAPLTEQELMALNNIDLVQSPLGQWEDLPKIIRQIPYKEFVFMYNHRLSYKDIMSLYLAFPAEMPTDQKLQKIKCCLKYKLYTLFKAEDYVYLVRILQSVRIEDEMRKRNFRVHPNSILRIAVMAGIKFLETVNTQLEAAFVIKNYPIYGGSSLQELILKFYNDTESVISSSFTKEFDFTESFIESNKDRYMYVASVLGKLCLAFLNNPNLKKWQRFKVKKLVEFEILGVLGENKLHNRNTVKLDTAWKEFQFYADGDYWLEECSSLEDMLLSTKEPESSAFSFASGKYSDALPAKFEYSSKTVRVTRNGYYLCSFEIALALVGEEECCLLITGVHPANLSDRVLHEVSDKIIAFVSSKYPNFKVFISRCYPLERYSEKLTTDSFTEKQPRIYTVKSVKFFIRKAMNGVKAFNALDENMVLIKNDATILCNVYRIQ